MRVESIALVFALGLSQALAAPAAPVPRIAGITARLLYERTGTLSGNILPPASFSGWNTIIGEGDAREPANDILVTVDLAITGDEANIDLPLVITVKGQGDKLLARRTVAHHLFTKGHEQRSLLVPEAGCAGKMLIEVSLGPLKKTSQVELRCGE